MEILFTSEAKNPFILESHLGSHNTFEIPLEGEAEWDGTQSFKRYKSGATLFTCSTKSLTTLHRILTEFELNLKLPRTRGPEKSRPQAPE